MINPTRSEVRETDYEDELAADERQAQSHSVSTAYAPETARQLRKGSIVVACVLIVALLLVRIVGFLHEHALAGQARAAVSTPHTVQVISAAPVGTAQHFALPGQTAAWHSSTIYARVNGYVASWVVDIGDHVHSGQVMATIDTPELDAQLSAARAQLQDGPGAGGGAQGRGGVREDHLRTLARFSRRRRFGAGTRGKAGRFRHGQCTAAERPRAGGPGSGARGSVRRAVSL